MNYYEQHIGDYAKDAGYLSMIEDGAYRRLIDAYYAREQALPVDVRECCKLARASTKLERDAVAYVLREFFTLQDDGHHQKRCDAEIERYLDAEPDREQKKENAKERQRRSRERRKQLFDSLRSHGITPSYDTPTNELEARLSRVTVTQNVTPVTRDDTVTHTPLPTSHFPEAVGKIPTHPEIPKPDGGGVCGPSPPPPEVLAAIGLRKLGVRITPQNPELIASVAEGVTPEALIAMAETYPGKPAGYVISACRRQRAEAANPSAAARAGPPGKPSIAQQFAEKNYQGTPDDQLPEYLRTHSA